MVSILGANSVSGDYEVSNSLRFNDGDTAKLARTPSGAGDKKTWTWSGWVKRSTLGAIQGLFVVDTGSAESALGFLADDTLRFYQNGQTNGLVTNAVFRDVAAWYHIVLISDTTESTESSRTKLYINGEQVTSFAHSDYLSQNADTEFNTTNPHEIGFYSNQTGGAGHFDGYMAEVHFIDGTAKAHTDFGETNDNGVWIPKKYSGSYGTNGFKLEFKQTGTSQNSSGIGADTSGNDNHFAVTNLAGTDITTDTCTNNFCTLNSLFNTSSLILKEGNLHTESSSGAGGSASTYNISNGKWYFETCYIFGVASYAEMGIINSDASFSDIGHTTNTGSVLYRADGKIYKNTGSGFSVDQTVTAASTGDIIGIAINLNDQEISFYLNNTQVGSTVDISYMSNDIIIRLGFGYHVAKLVANFGQEGSFAGNKTAQGNSDANGYGDFYYSPPSGYYALCTKNLAEFG